MLTFQRLLWANLSSSVGQSWFWFEGVPSQLLQRDDKMGRIKVNGSVSAVTTFNADWYWCSSQQVRTKAVFNVSVPQSRYRCGLFHVCFIDPESAETRPTFPGACRVSSFSFFFRIESRIELPVCRILAGWQVIWWQAVVKASISLHIWGKDGNACSRSTFCWL